MAPHDLDPAVVDRVIAEVAVESNTPGIAFGVVVDGRLVHHGGVGVLGPGKGSPGAQSRFRIASMTKSFTAAAALRLRDSGALALDDPVAAHAPELATVQPPTADSPAITIRHLLTMASGIATDDAWADRRLDATDDDMDGLFAFGATFAVAPGTAMEYSNYGYAMLGRVVARVAGVRLQDYVSEHLLGPLGLHNTTWSVADVDSADVAEPYQRIGDEVVADMAPLADGGFAPMGGLWSTVADLAVWVSFLCDAFPPRDDPDDTTLRRSSRREMQQIARSLPLELSETNPSRAQRPSALGYGMGLLIGHDPRFGAVVGHSGGVPGYGSNMRWLPERRFGVIALGNVMYAPMWDATYRVIERLDANRMLPDPPTLTPSPVLRDAAAALVGLLDHWDDGAADQLFAVNVFLDESCDRRRAAAQRLRAALGTLVVERVETETRTSGTVVVRGERGEAKVSLALTSAVPPMIQSYTVTATVDLT